LPRRSPERWNTLSRPEISSRRWGVGLARSRNNASTASATTALWSTCSSLRQTASAPGRRARARRALSDHGQMLVLLIALVAGVLLAGGIVGILIASQPRDVSMLLPLPDWFERLL